MQVWPSDYYPLLIFEVGSNGGAIGSPRAVKGDFRALGWLFKGSGARAMFSSVLPVADNKGKKQEEPADQNLSLRLVSPAEFDRWCGGCMITGQFP